MTPKLCLEHAKNFNAVSFILHPPTAITKSIDWYSFNQAGALHSCHGGVTIVFARESGMMMFLSIPCLLEKLTLSLSLIEDVKVVSLSFVTPKVAPQML